MAVPHLCPNCKGSKRVRSQLTPNSVLENSCPTCDGTGVVWETTLSDAVAANVRQTLQKPARGALAKGTAAGK